MIYLIRSACYKDINNKECNEFDNILKIGYTKDNSKKSRFNVYITENPSAQILYLIPGGTEYDERNLHNYFRKYLKYGREWFSYESEILEFFKTHTTKESLKELNYLREDLQILVKRKYFDKILLNITDYGLYKITKNNLYSDLNRILNTVDNLDSYFKSLYPDIDFDEINNTEDNKDYDFIESFKSEFEQDRNFIRRMKMYYRLVTEFADIYQQNIKIFNSIVPTNYQWYMNLLGPERIKANGYIEVDIRNETGVILGCNNIKAEILINFKPGNKYSSKNTKQTLKNIYDKLGIEKTAKASELENYFSLKECTVFNQDTGKWDRGFEILGVKEDSV